MYNNNIKHIVLSGGGPVGLVQYGILKRLSLENVIKYENIQSIYATSIGGFVALVYLLNFEWSWIDDFFVKRPWENLINFTSYDYINIFYTKGLLNSDLILDAIKPLLLAKDLSLNITLKELFEFSNIDLHLFTTNVNDFKKVDINYKDFPGIKLIEALTMTCAIPVLITPMFYKENYYLDGCIFVNTPFYECLKTEKCNKKEILTLVNDKDKPIDVKNPFYKNYKTNNTNIKELTEDINLINFLIYLLKIIFNKLLVNENNNNNTNIKIKNKINIGLNVHHVDIKYWSHVFTNSEEREYLINLGEKQAKKYIKKINKNTSINTNHIDIDNTNNTNNDIDNNDNTNNDIDNDNNNDNNNNDNDNNDNNDNDNSLNIN